MYCILCKHRLVSLFDHLMEETNANQQSFIFKMQCASLDFSLFTIYTNSSMYTAFENVKTNIPIITSQRDISVDLLN